MLHYLDKETSAEKVGGLQPITLLKNITYFPSSFYTVLTTVPLLAETISVIYYARNGCDKDEFLEKKLMNSASLRLSGT